MYLACFQLALLETHDSIRFVTCYKGMWNLYLDESLQCFERQRAVRVTPKMDGAERSAACAARCQLPVHHCCIALHATARNLDQRPRAQPFSYHHHAAAKKDQ
jgi:hypothetical protein